MSKVKYGVTVYTSSTNEIKHLKPQAVLDIFQYGAVKHSEEYKIDGPSIVNQDVIWILVTNKYEVLKHENGQGNYEIETWPRKSNSRIKHFREYILKNENGEVVIKGTSVWCLFDLNKKLPCSRPEISFPFELIDECVMDGEPNKIPTLDIKTAAVLNSFPILRSYYDSNHHTNNAVYGQFIYECLNENETVKKLQIDYINQTYVGDIIDIYSIKNAAKPQYFAGYCGDKLIFKALVEVE